MLTRLILIRHGSTEWNLKKRYCGWIDLSLSETGKVEAEKLCRKIGKLEVDKIYSSDRKRAIQTAKIIFKKRKIEIAPDLREVHFGVFEGLTHNEILDKYSLIYKKWLKNPYQAVIPKAERLTKFKQRVIGALKKIICANHGKTVAVVCHGGTISIYLNHLLKSKKFWYLIPKSTSMSVVEFKKGKAKIKILNDASHL